MISGSIKRDQQLEMQVKYEIKPNLILQEFNVQRVEYIVTNHHHSTIIGSFGVVIHLHFKFCLNLFKEIQVT